MIKINQLNKSFGTLNILNDISFTIERGRICGLVGKSGVGKSTLLRCINGLESYQSGSVTINGVEISSLSKKELNSFRKNIGMIFQHFSLIDRKTVYDNIALPMRCWKIPKKEIQARVKELLKLTGLEDKINVKTRNLSGGQKQRVAIARALTMNPEILLCDEATSALDPKTTKDILNLLKKINESLDITIIVVTHQMSVVRQICDDVILLEDGHVVENGHVDEVFMRYSPALERFAGVDELEIKSGCNYRITFKQDINNNDFMSRMGVELKNVYSIIYSSTEQFKENKYDTYMIGIPEDFESDFVNYFKHNNVSYRKILLNDKEET